MATIVNTVTDPQAKVERRLAALETAQVRNQQINTSREIGGGVLLGGGIFRGGGFTVSKGGTGIYVLTFSVAFPAIPIVVASSWRSEPAEACQTECSSVNFAVVQALSPTGTLVDSAFSVIIKLY